MIYSKIKIGMFALSKPRSEITTYGLIEFG